MAHRFALIVIGRLDHQHGIVAATESDLGNFDVRIADIAVLHESLLIAATATQ
jgi:hypothetical protein